MRDSFKNRRQRWVAWGTVVLETGQAAGHDN